MAIKDIINYKVVKDNLIGKIIIKIKEEPHNFIIIKDIHISFIIIITIIIIIKGMG